jgi:hypothetical protein
MSWEDYSYWLTRKADYQRNLDAGIGHKQSIEALLEKINRKLSTAVVRR